MTALLENHGPIAIAFVFICIGLLSRMCVPRRSRFYPSEDNRFANQPWLYDQAIIECVGRVERVFADSFTERIQRWLVDKLRSLVRNADPQHRYSHQRFLISSPALPSTEWLLVHHNISYGRLALQPGDWIRLTGTYVHSPQPAASLARRKFRYGLVHKTHAPHGEIVALKKRPSEHNCLIAIRRQVSYQRAS